MSNRTWRWWAPLALATSLVVIDSTTLALVVIATTTAAIAALSVFFGWRTWVQQFSDWRSDSNLNKTGVRLWIDSSAIRR
jgi:hypothetical protein